MKRSFVIFVSFSFLKQNKIRFQTEVQMFGESGQPDGDWDLEVDNMAVIKKPINTGQIFKCLVIYNVDV